MQLIVRCMGAISMLFLAGCLLIGPALALDLNVGDARNQVTGRFHNESIASKLFAAEFYGMSGFVTLDGGLSYYALIDTTLVKYDIGLNTVSGSWPLTRWESDYIEDEILRTFYHGRQWPGVQDYYDDLTGCIARGPLRYGDFSGNDKAEIVLFLPDDFTLDMLVFSLDKGKVIFSHPVATTDSIAEDDADQTLLHTDASRHSQYYVRSGQEIIGKGWAMKPAVRAYGKIYTGDFNENGARDLLVWRKLFLSRSTSDQVTGFEKLRETWLHYALVDGEYQQLDTPEATIRNWLSGNNLTWQKGYPNKSECAGHEGELIPEMHDPLLNDPDVLQ